MKPIANLKFTIISSAIAAALLMASGEGIFLPSDIKQASFILIITSLLTGLVLDFLNKKRIPRRFSFTISLSVLAMVLWFVSLFAAGGGHGPGSSWVCLLFASSYLYRVVEIHCVAALLISWFILSVAQYTLIGFIIDKLTAKFSKQLQP